MPLLGCEAIILIVSIALMNLVTAVPCLQQLKEQFDMNVRKWFPSHFDHEVLVEGALENAQNDKEADKVDLQEKLKRADPQQINS